MVARSIPDLPDSNRLVYRAALVVVIVTAVLLLAGAEVTSTNSGMAFATWPDSDGELLWPNNPTLSRILEHSHRLIGALVGICAIVLVVLTFLRDPRPLMRKLSIALLLFVIIQGLLGGFRVKMNEQFPIFSPMLHGTLAQLLFSFMGFVAYAASMAWVPQAVEDGKEVRTARRLAVFSWICVFIQIFLGVLTRHGNYNSAKWAHISFAFLAAFAVLIAASYSLGKFGKISGFKRTNRTLLAVLVVQVVFGFITLMVRRPKDRSDTELMGKATLVSVHVVLGAGLLLLVTILVARSYRNLRPRATP